MLRLRVLRVLLPALLVPFLVLIGLTFRQRPVAVGGRAAHPEEASGPRAERIELTELWNDNRRLFLRAAVGELKDDGKLRLEGVERVEVDRDRGGPLVFSSQRGEMRGKEGDRVLALEGEVRVEDRNAGLHVEVPGVEVEEATREARSVGTLTLRGPGYTGTAARAVHGLDRESPSSLEAPSIRGDDGSTLTALSAVVRAQGRVIDLAGNVRVDGNGARLSARDVTLTRSESGRIRLVEASGSATVEGVMIAALPASVVANRLSVAWDDSADPSRASATGSVTLHRGDLAVEASALDATRNPDGRNWSVAARGGVRARGIFQDSSSTLRTEDLLATIDADRGLMRAEAKGAVRFVSQGANAEADHASFVPELGGGVITLDAAPGRRARLAQGRSRVAAETIVTDPRGDRMRATGRVEATLLGTSQRLDVVGGVFDAGEAVHFVASSLDGDSGGGRLTFRGDVRGWQGDRNLSAQEVEIERSKDVLRARGAVTSRFPRASDSGNVESDYVQIAADRLDYEGAARRARYDGGTKVRLSEGWLEGRSLEVDLEPSGGRIREIRVADGVGFELRPTAGGPSDGLTRGSGDRVIYSPVERLVRLFGDQAPASVSRSGGTGGTTMGRVLRYRLDLGTLEVESGDPASGDGTSGEREGARLRDPSRMKTAIDCGATGLAADGLEKRFGRRAVVRGVSVRIGPGEIVGLLGPNGAGKTTSFHLILGLVPPDGGRVMLDDEDITALPMYLRARRGVGYLPQEASIFRRMTVEENILAVLEIRGVGRAEAAERCSSLLSEFGLQTVARSSGYSLSGGERRRAEIARALAAEPRYMLLDEPFAGIDPIAVADLQTLVARLKQRGIGVLITDHNVRETLQITDRAYIISQGSIFRQGTPSDLASDPEVRRVYLGENFRLH